MSDKATALAGPANCHGIILAGGAGMRLWPLSRNLLPKQLLPLDDKESLLQQTVRRVLEVFPPERIWIVTNEEHVFEVRSQVLSIEPGLETQILAEPLRRDTLPAILMALDRVAEADPESLAVVFPSDHRIHGLRDWAGALVRAAELAREGHFVTFGIPPDKPETGYGYIARGKALGKGAYRVEGFVEKPDMETAQGFVAGGLHLWNSGMFLFKVRSFLKCLAQHQPKLWDWWMDREQIPLPKGYRDLPSISVDFGVVEHLDNIAVVEATFGWDDLGSWGAMYRLAGKDADGNAVQGDVLNLGCSGSLLLSKGGKLAAVGLKDMLVVQTRDAVLACPLSEVQQVREVVAALKREQSPLVESHPLVKRPWGSYCVLEEGDRFKIKRIQVLPGASLSKQMHHHRTEHWVVVQGTATVEVGEEVRVLVENQSVDIPQATSHRLTNPGKVPLEIIEIQSGLYLEEDDIVRFEDVYGRMKRE